MIEANLYQLTIHPLQKAMPRLVEGVALTRGKKVRILCANAQQVKECDDVLWSYAQLSFLPHGTSTDPYPDAQLIYITAAANDNANNAPVLLIYDVTKFEDYLGELGAMGYVEKLVMLLDPNQNALIDTLKNTLTKMNISCKLFVQNNDGSWKNSIL